MADEGSHIPSGGRLGKEFEAAAEAALRSAQRVEQAADRVETAEQRTTRAVENEAAARDRIRDVERRFEARAIVDEQGRPVGGIRGGARSSRPLHEIVDVATGQRAAGTGEYTRAENARRRAAELSRAQASAVEQAEETQTRAVQEGASKRTQARREESNVVKGNAAEFERLTADIAADARRQVELHRQGVDPAASNVEQEIAQQRRRAEAVETVAKREQEVARRGVDMRRALAGAADPRFAEVFERFGADVSQYRMRQEVEGLGSRRATGIQQAFRAGFRPAGDAEQGALTRAQAAHQAAAAADVEKTAASREYTNTVRAASKQQATQEQVNTAYERQQRALTARTAALAEIKTAEALADQSATRAAREEAAARQREAGRGQYPAPAGPPRRPPGYGQYPTAIGPEGPPPGHGQYPSPIGPERRPPRFGADPNQYARAIGPQLATSYDEARLAAHELSREQSILSRQMERSAIVADLSSQKFRKHGALTTEFIEAAARGQVTVAELGYQMTATIGKFAGWTAAATAVYGVVGALSQVTQGAIAASSAVGLVHRVVTEDFDAGRLQEGLIGLSEKFNVSIDDAAQATYGAGKVFNDLPGALKGADSALFAMKVGELDAASANEALTGIVRGFKLEVSDLPDVFDNINQAQNRFGGNVGQLTQGVAKASGQFQLAGGSYNELIAILTTGSRVAGTTATETATAVNRMVSSIQTPAGAARARRAGVDPTQDPLSLIRQLQRLAKGASPERVQELARAVIPAGGQFARVLVPLIQNAELLNNVLAETSPEERKGSAQRELAKALSQVNEEIAKVGTSLQRIGARAADAGLLFPFVALLKTLNLILDATADVLKVMGNIPDPFKTLAASGLELYGVLRLLRRFDIGGQIASGGRGERLRQFVAATPAQRERRQVLEGVKAERDFLLEARARAGREAATARARERFAQSRFHAAEGAGESEKVIARRASEYQRAAQRAEDLAEEELEYRTLINDNERKRNVFLRESRTKSNEAAAAIAGATYRTETAARPTTRGPAQIAFGGPLFGGVPVDQPPAGRPLGRLQLTGQQRFEQRLAGLSRDAARFPQAQVALATALGGIGAASTQITTAANRSGVTGRAAAGAARGATRAVVASGAGIRAAGTALTGLASSLRASLGPLDLALIGGTVAYAAGQKLADDAKKEADELDRVTAPSADPAKDLKAIRDRLKSGPDTSEIPGLIAARSDREDRIKLQARGVGLGQGEVERRLRTARARAGSPREEASALRTAMSQLDRGYETTFVGGEAAEKARDRIRQLASQLAALSGTASAVEAALKAASDFKGVNEVVADQAAKLELSGGRSRGAQRGIGLALRRSAQLYADTGDAAGYLESLKTAESAITDDAEQRLERAQDVARTPGARRRARRGYEGEVRRGFGIPAAEQRLEQLRRGGRRRDQQREQLAAAPRDPDLPPQFRTDALRKLDQADRDARQEGRGLRQGLRRRRQLLRDIARKGSEEDFQWLQEYREAETTLGAARRPAGMERIGYQLTRMGQTVRRVIARYGRHSKEAMQAMAEQIDLQNQLVEQHLANIQADAEYAASLATTPAGESAANVEGMRNALAFMRANPRQYGYAERRQQQAQINSALKQQREDAKQRREQQAADARELLDARYEYLGSLTDDPVQQARIEERHAAALLARGGFKNQAERYRAMAQVNNARRAREKAVVDARIENLDFDRSIERISEDAYIRGLRRIEGTLKAGSQLRKEVHRKILQAQHDAAQGSEGFSLDVGNIRLPSVYEVHRAIKEGRRGVSARNTTVNNSPTVNVYLSPGDDGSAVIATLDNELGTSARSVLRATGEI